METSVRNCPLLTLTFILSCGPPALADHWGHWRGDNGNGVSNNATPPTEWSSTKNVKWKVRIPGQGSGSPVIWEDKVYVVSGVPGATERVTAALPAAALPVPNQQSDRQKKKPGTQPQQKPCRTR